MAIKFACPSCGKGYNVKEELAGKKAKCQCGAVMPIPSPAAAPTPVENDPLFGDDPLGGELFVDSARPSVAASASNSLFDEEFPTGDSVPSAPTQYQQPQSQASTHDPAATPQSPAATPAAGYAVAVPTVGRIQDSEPDPTVMGGGGAFLIGIGLSGAGAAVGAIIWALIAIVTGFEIGWIAWGVGFCSGVGMAIAHNLSDEIDDFLGGVIASLMAILGILAGKFAVYQFVVLASLGELGEIGELLEDEISFGMMFGPMDALFFFLAVATAYKLGSGGGDDD